MVNPRNVLNIQIISRSLTVYIVSYCQVKPKFQIQLLDLTQPQQDSQLEPELGAAQPQFVLLVRQLPTADELGYVLYRNIFSKSLSIGKNIFKTLLVFNAITLLNTNLTW